jgi:hypothetical protein
MDRQTGTTVVEVFRSMGCFVVSSVNNLDICIYEREMDDRHQNKTVAINNESVNIDTLHRPVMTHSPCRPVTLDTHRSGQQRRHRHTASCPRGITD